MTTQLYAHVSLIIDSTIEMYYCWYSLTMRYGSRKPSAWTTCKTAELDIPYSAFLFPSKSIINHYAWNHNLRNYIAAVLETYYSLFIDEQLLQLQYTIISYTISIELHVSHHYDRCSISKGCAIESWRIVEDFWNGWFGLFSTTADIGYTIFMWQFLQSNEKLMLSTGKYIPCFKQPFSAEIRGE